MNLVLLARHGRLACSIRLGVSVVVALVTWLVTSEAVAMSCIDHAYERMAVERIAVTRNGEEVEPPPELADVDEILNSGGPKEVLVWNKSTMAGGKFYLLAEPAQPTPAVSAFVKSQSARRLRTSCRYDVDYTPILPGLYRFSQEHMGGEKVPKDLEDPMLVVAPGRDKIELRFGLRGEIFRATYRVLCASFEWDKAPKCAVAESSELGFPAVMPAVAKEPVKPREPEVEAATPSPSTAPTSKPESTSVAPASRPRGCGGCTVSPGSAERGIYGALLALVGLTAMRRRKRSAQFPEAKDAIRNER